MSTPPIPVFRPGDKKQEVIPVRVLAVAEANGSLTITYTYKNGDGEERTLKQSRRVAPPPRPRQAGLLYVPFDDNSPMYIFPLPVFC